MSDEGERKEQKTRVVIIGAVGYDFHVFITVFRDDPTYEVVAFTYAGEQNVGTFSGGGKHTFPAGLTGDLNKEIPMYPEADLTKIIRELHVDEAVFAYSDVRHEKVMHVASMVLASGANFRIISPRFSQIKARVPVVSVCAVRTGCGKSNVSRLCYNFFRERGYRVVAIREPMPYGDLMRQEVMRFASEEDLVENKVTIEEREEYEGYVTRGMVIYSGVDYEKIVREAEKEADVIIFDGGNNEISFYKPDFLFVVTDPLRSGDESLYHPGEVNVCCANSFIINKVNSSTSDDVQTLEKALRSLNQSASIIKTKSEVTVPATDADRLKGATVLVVEDGPSVTHGNMAFGAGLVAAQLYGAVVINPKECLRGSLKDTFDQFPHLTNVVPCMGYDDAQRKDLEASLNAADCDFILNGSPMNLEGLITCNKPIIQVSYDVVPFSEPTIEGKLEEFEKNVIHPFHNDPAYIG